MPKRFKVIPKNPQTPAEVVIKRDALAAMRVMNINKKFDRATKKITLRR